VSEIVEGPPFPLGWEQQPGIDECAHVWAKLIVRPYPGSRLIAVERCSRCLVPRCSTRNAFRSPCRDRRHHAGVHVFEDGSFEPLGGVLK
jgi:hypothetical protein